MGLAPLQFGEDAKNQVKLIVLLFVLLLHGMLELFLNRREPLF